MIRVAIVGFGQVAEHGHYPAYAASSDFEVVAVIERTEQRRAAARALNARIRAVANLDDLATDDLDLVDVCTPPALHAAPMQAALDRGWHVVCEKPFLIDVKTLDMVLAHAARAGRAVIPVHNWKYAPIVERATTLLRNGVIGALRHVRIETLRLKDCATADPEHPNWRRDPAIAGGGILMDHGWHAVYLALHWFGEATTGVSASLHRPADGAAEDEARATLRFPSGDASIFLSWNADRRRNEAVLTGRAGELRLADDALLVRSVDGRTWPAEPFPALSAGSHHADWFARMLPDIRDACADPSRARPSLDEAARCLTAITQAYDADARANLARMASSIAPR